MEKEEQKEHFRKRIKQFVLSLIEFTDSLSNHSTSRIIAQQLIRSGMSVGANYFEARAASSKKDYVNFFTYALKSANETKFWLETLIEAKKCDHEKGFLLLREVSELANILAASILTMKGKSKYQLSKDF